MWGAAALGQAGGIRATARTLTLEDTLCLLGWLMAGTRVNEVINCTLRSGTPSTFVAARTQGFSSSAAAAPLLPPPLDMAELAAMGQEQLVRSLRSRCGGG